MALVKNNQGNVPNSRLFDILWNIGTDEAYREMIDVIMPLVNKNDPNAIRRLAKAYAEGKGVELDSQRATELLLRI